MRMTRRASRAQTSRSPSRPASLRLHGPSMLSRLHGLCLALSLGLSGCTDPAAELQLVDTAGFQSEALESSEVALVVFARSDNLEKALAARKQLMGVAVPASRIYWVDITTSPEVAAQAKVRNTPAIIAYANGQELERYLGDHNPNALRMWVAGVTTRHAMANGEIPASGPELFTLTDAGFEDSLAKAGKPFLVEFGAEWCTYCRALEVHLRDVAAEHAAELAVGRVDVDTNPQLYKRFVDDELPVLIFFRNGQEVDRIYGAPTADRLRQWVGFLLQDSQLAPPEAAAQPDAAAASSE